MNEANSQQLSESSATQMGPGERLQAARIAVGMTIEDVAGKMHLSTQILRSLEENDFDEITAPIFVKGYLRAYARLVHIDEHEIIDQYNQMYTDGDPPIASIRNTVPEINANDARVKWTTYLVIIVLFTLLTIWWWNRYQQPEQAHVLDGNSQPATTADIVVADDSVAIPSLTDNGQSQTDDDQAVETNIEMSQDTSMTVEDVTSSEALDTVPDSNTENEPAQAVETADTPPSEISTVTTESEPVIVDSEVTATDPNQLTVIVNADTWTDVRDASGEKLVYDLLRSGEKVTVSGQPPYRAFFGNGYGVSMLYQGKEVDVASKIQANNTARVRIGN